LLNDKKRGFSLLVVLIVSMIAMTLAGALLNLSVSASGAGRTNSARDVKYNILQDGIERGKAELMRIVENTSQIPKYTDKFDGTEPAEIADLDTLLINDGNVLTQTLTKSELSRLGITGGSATFKIRIYDMQYKPELVPSVDSGKITAKEIESFPPAMTVAAGSSSSDGEVLEMDYNGTTAGGRPEDAGIYLIRASLEIEGNNYSLDTAMIQSRKD
jgi:hypothetical protein